MFATYSYLRQYNNEEEIDNYKEFYKKFSNEREFGGEFTNYDHLVKNRFMNILGHIYNAILRKQPKRILDIGCGNGINLPLANLFSFIDFHAIDYAEKAIEQASKQYSNIKFKVGDAFNLPYEDKKFDMAILSSVMILYKDEKDRLNLLKEANRILNDDGILMLIVWNEASLLKKSIQISRFIGKIKKQNMPKDFMAYMFKPREIKDMVKKSNFKIEEQINTGHLYGILESVRYLNMGKYNRTFGKNESEANKFHSQNILEDLIDQGGNSVALTKLFYSIGKVYPNLFSMYSIYILRK